MWLSEESWHMGVYNFHSYLGKNWTGSRSTDAGGEMTRHLAGEPILVLPLSKRFNKLMFHSGTTFQAPNIYYVCYAQKLWWWTRHRLMWNQKKVWQIFISNSMKLDIKVNTIAVGGSSISTNPLLLNHVDLSSISTPSLASPSHGHPLIQILIISYLQYEAL